MIRLGTLPAGVLLGQQRTLGNQAVQRLLRTHGFQGKLTVTPSDDVYEREAGAVTNAVMALPEPLAVPLGSLQPHQLAERALQAESASPQTPAVQSSSAPGVVQREPSRPSGRGGVWLIVQAANEVSERHRASGYS